MKIKIAVDEDSEHVGGLTIFGENFGNHPQDIQFNLYYSENEKWAIKQEPFVTSFLEVPNISFQKEIWTPDLDIYLSWISGLQQDVLFTLAAISNLQYVVSSILGVDNQKKEK